jgi:hypothetical protein
MSIAAQENHTRSGWRTWDATDAAYLQLLISKAKYQPTDWEQACLDAISEADHTDDVDDGELDDDEGGDDADLVDAEEAN